MTQHNKGRKTPKDAQPITPLGGQSPGRLEAHQPPNKTTPNRPTSPVTHSPRHPEDWLPTKNKRHKPRV